MMLKQHTWDSIVTATSEGRPWGGRVVAVPSSLGRLLYVQAEHAGDAILQTVRVYWYFMRCQCAESEVPHTRLDLTQRHAGTVTRCTLFPAFSGGLPLVHASHQR